MFIKGTTYPLYKVPTPDGVIHTWALVKPTRLVSQFIDPAHPEQGLITWKGSWRSLDGVYRFRIYWDNYVNLWKTVNYLHLLKNTSIIVILSEIGILLSSICGCLWVFALPHPGRKVPVLPPDCHHCHSR